MGMEVPVAAEKQRPIVESELVDLSVLTTRPSILLVGPPDVGKRSLLNRLIAKKTSPPDTSVSGVSCHGWTIDTKYYTADVCIWMGHLDSTFLEDSCYQQPQYGRSQALVMVFDLSEDSTFKQLQDWAASFQLEKFEILLCVGNKADHVPDHFAHAEYRRKVQKGSESSSDPHPEFWDFGIDRSEGSSLLAEDSPAEDSRRSRIQWCAERGIEYIESCAINEVFDKCMSVDGDLQGVARIHGALSAHMWPGLVMKDSNQRPSSQAGQEGSTSDDDSDYCIEYELLSNGSAEPWDECGWEEQWTQAPAAQYGSVFGTNGDTVVSNGTADAHQGDRVSEAWLPVENQRVDEHQQVQVNNREAETQQYGPVENAIESGSRREQADNGVGLSAHARSDFDEMEQLMHEMATMRENMRNVSDHHRREMAAQLAMRMAAMFDAEDDEDDDRSD